MLSSIQKVGPPFRFNKVALHLIQMPHLGLWDWFDKTSSLVCVTDPRNAGFVSTESMLDLSGRVPQYPCIASLSHFHHHFIGRHSDSDKVM